MANETSRKAERKNPPAKAEADQAVPETQGPSAEEMEAAIFQQRMAATIKGCSGNTQKAKPQRKMLRAIAKMHPHPGKGLGIKRWHLYRVGMTLQDAKVTPGLCHLDITFWEKNKLVEMREATEAEWEAALAAWEASKPREAAAESA